MYNYAALRRLRKQLGTTNSGKPIFGGPYDWNRDGPILAVAAVLATFVALAGFVAVGLPGLFLGVFGAGLVGFGAFYLIGKLRKNPEGYGIDQWISQRIDMHFARPTTIDGPNPFHENAPKRQPSRAFDTLDIIDGNVRVTDEGCWAEYRIGNPLEMGLVGPRQQANVLSEHQSLFEKTLQRSSYIAQFKEPISSNELIERAFTEKDRDPEQIAQYANIACDQIDDLWERAKDDPGEWPYKLHHVMGIYVGDSPGSAAAIRDELISDLPFSWNLIPASRQQMYWVWYSQCTAGVKLTAADQLEIPEVLPTVVLEDGAYSDSPFSKRSKWFFRKRDLLPVVKVTVDDGPPSYQAVLTARLPDVLEFPEETDFLSVLSHMGEHITPVIRAVPKSNDRVQYENRKAVGIIEDNTIELAPFDRREDPYARENELVETYDQNLGDDNATVATLLVSVAASTPDEVKRIARGVRDVLKKSGLRVNDPEPGKQEELWATLQPGARRTAALDTHAFETTTHEFAELVPFTSASIGHLEGPVIGRNLTSGLGELVRFAAEKLILAGRGAIMAIVSSLGGGKSTLGKILAIYAHLRGHSWGALDRSDIVEPDYPDGIGEWAKLKSVLRGVQVVDITKPPGSFDPLKVWADDPETASKHTYNMHIELQEGLDDRQKLALAEALDPTQLHKRGLVSQMALARYLKGLSDGSANIVGRKIEVWKHRPFARAIFDESLPPLELTKRGTVIRTHGLTLPSEGKVLHKHLNDKLRPEERYGPVIYSLASVFLKAVFRKRRGPAYIFVDEAWAVTRNPIGLELIEVDIRDGRKHFIIVVFMTHAAERDFEDEVFKLITVKFLGRAENEDLARSNARWFNAMPITDDLIDDLMAAKDGRFYMSMTNDDVGRDPDKPMRDANQRRQVAEIQVLRPIGQEYIDALNTTPTMVQGVIDDDEEAA